MCVTIQSFQNLCAHALTFLLQVHALCLVLLCCSFTEAGRGYSRVVDLTQLMNPAAYKWPIYSKYMYEIWQLAISVISVKVIQSD